MFRIKNFEALEIFSAILAGYTMQPYIYESLRDLICSALKLPILLEKVVGCGKKAIDYFSYQLE